MKATKDWDKLGAVGSNAALTENKNAVKPTAPTVKPKHLRAVPVAYFDRHDALKETGQTSLDFTSYIIEAIREKLDRDENA
ncbi:hypothetical protein [Photobacterium leiognathi]|uniref:hypothetical protein n=1 Tax=Photobacterium leiognathi TaxID=553611 RepID=UPI000D17A2F9|nr:hypothetical protein [Photobacterium leiognathi]PSW53052.1 hypothetical protein C0W50_19785 [Photobacterium leiognathi subsp. mandapamensis]